MSKMSSSNCLSAITLLSLCVGTFAVTSSSNTPTLDSNYMIMQGDISYISGGADFGAISGRIQMDRSALVAQTSFSYSLHFTVNGNAPAAGTEIVAKLGRQICAVGYTAYQDPYQCPGYSLVLNSNTCSSSSSVEVEIPCTVDLFGACTGSFNWPIYIPEQFEDQNIETLSMMFFSGGSAFACGNFDANRALTGSALENGITLSDALLEKDELGYTHVSADFQDLLSSSTYGVEVRNGPCSEVNAPFAPTSPVPGLSASFTSDSSGEASVQFFISSTANASTQSMVIAPSGESPTACFSLELASIFGFSKSVNDNSTTAATTPVVVMQDQDDNGGCDAWMDLYMDVELGVNGKGKKGKKSKKGKNGLSLDDFEATDVNGNSRCCLSSTGLDKLEEMQNRAKKGKHKSSSVFSQSLSPSDAKRAQAGLGAGIAGLVVMTAGVAMHIRRRRLQAMQNEQLSDAEPIIEMPTEKTALLED